MPSKVTFGDGNSVSYMYAADGRKLQTKYMINGVTTTTDYVGNIIYENGALKHTLVDGGYYENNEYYFYLKDHLGNNRVVAKQDGSVVHTSEYYPYGMEFASNTNRTVQPYRYNGKELDAKGGLNLYDYGARHYDPVLGRFMTVDPMAEKYYGWSPYAYCLGNPAKYIDSDGRQVVTVPGPVPFPIYYPIVPTNYRYPTTYEIKQAVNNGVNSAANFVKDSFSFGILTTFSTVASATQAISPEYDHQRNREKKEKRELDQNQANVAKSIDTNVSGMMPNGDPAPKRDPKDGGKKIKIGLGVIFTGLGADVILETSNPKPGEDAIQAHTNKETERIQKKEPTIWENIINYFITNKNKE